MWNIIDKISAIAGIITFIVFIGTVLMVLSRTYRFKKRIAMTLEKGSSSRIALIVSLKPNEHITENEIKDYLSKKNMNMNIDYFKVNGVSSDTLPTLRKRFLTKKQELSNRGISEVHLFYKGPVAAAFFLADVLNNWKPVYIYHFSHDSHNKGYECWGLLTESLERLATEELIKEVVQDA